MHSINIHDLMMSSSPIIFTTLPNELKRFYQWKQSFIGSRRKLKVKYINILFFLFCIKYFQSYRWLYTGSETDSEWRTR